MKNLLSMARSLTGRNLRRVTTALGLGAAIRGSLVLTAPAHATPADLIGEWCNTNHVSICGGQLAGGAHLHEVYRQQRPPVVPCP